MTTALTLFFDSRCPLCSAEMRRLERWDKHGRLAYIDMHGEGFDAADYGTTLAAMDAELHGLDVDGRLLVGIDAIAAAYSAVGFAWLVWPLKLALTKPLWRKTYRWFARNRYRASRLLGYRCPDGVCDLRMR
ncbi:thiol-disulfide oxidoreductase DCC family protein [Chitinimonas sp. PSY-7]|uniref:DCC1-like thiol-disulfide oxidoreductase family protein n=1 Tax=Chitinimonas sp. PSY-7 TaxID=3459088 RepID=UPI00403FFDD3